MQAVGKTVVEFDSRGVFRGQPLTIGPEILLGQYDKPADVFALGLIMLEIAGNVQLPDNGPTWQRLRSGDMSDVPSLSWSTGSTIIRDATGIPIEETDASMNYFGSDDELEPNFGSPTMVSRRRNIGSSGKSFSHDPGNLPFLPLTDSTDSEHSAPAWSSMANASMVEHHQPDQALVW